VKQMQNKAAVVQVLRNLLGVRGARRSLSTSSPVESRYGLTGAGSVAGERAFRIQRLWPAARGQGLALGPRLYDCGP